MNNWIPFTVRELDEEERKEHPDWCYIMDCQVPDDGEEILVTNGKYVWIDTFCEDDGFYLDGGNELVEEVTAWMPLPEPYNKDMESAE